MPACASTAAPIAALSGIAIEESPLLQERNFGDLRGTAYADLSDDPFGPDFAPPNGEDWPMFHARVADAFQAGRVFLVGDAAHITPPFVGQGLVAGLRDVANLGWKLAWVCQGRARPGLLASYDEERRPHARAMVDLARFMGTLVAPASRLKAVVTHGSVKLLSRVPRLRRLFENLEIKPENRYAHGCFVRPARPSRLRRGGQVPQCLLRARDPARTVPSDDVLGAGFAMIGFGVDPSAGLPEALVHSWRGAGGTFVQIDPRGRPSCPSQSARWEDLTGALVPSVVPVGWVAIVRPDRTVMHDGPAASAAAMLRESMELFVETLHATQAEAPAADRAA